MKGLFWVLLLAGLAVAAALGARLNDGYLLLVVPPWRAEISLNLFIIALFGLFLAFYAVLRILAATFGLPQRLRVDNNRASSRPPKLRTGNCGRGAFHRRRSRPVRGGGACGKANVGMSNDKAGAKPAHR